MRTSTVLVCLGLLTFAIFTNGFRNANPDVACGQNDRLALLNFKQDLKDTANRLSSWVGENCCKWDGVICGNVTGHVRGIHLRNPYGKPDADIEQLPEFEGYLKFKLGGKLNPSLLNLKHLNYLDLSCNDFDGIQIPNFFGSLGSLRYLNLSQSGFRGTIPPFLGNLSLLHCLSLGGLNKYDEADLSAKNLQWLSGLSSLQHLEMTGVDLSSVFDWLDEVNKLSSLVELRLSDCQLSHIPPVAEINFTSLAILDLSSNFNFRDSLIPCWIFGLGDLVSLDFTGCGFCGPISSGLQNLTSLRGLYFSANSFNSTIPNWLYGFSRLEFLTLGENDFQGTISTTTGNLTSLVSLDLSSNQLEGILPRSLGNLCNLRKIDLSGNEFGGNVSDVLKIFSGCLSNRLESLEFGSNKLSGHLPNQLGQFKNLARLSFRGNLIYGHVPESIGKLSALRFLDLSHNNLNGTLPQSLGQLGKLAILIISNNFFKGAISEAHFANLTKLRILVAEGNLITFRTCGKWVPPFHLEYASLSSWKLGPQFPSWLRSQRKLFYLDMSKTEIVDPIPTWFWSIASQLVYLNLSCNQIHGKLPSMLFFPRLSAVDLGSNNFSCQLPLACSNVTFLDLSNNFLSGSLHPFLCDRMEKSNDLEFLNLANNLLSGVIPDCWMNWQSLSVIRLENNNMVGQIPSSMGYLTFLESLHLRNNYLSGTLPVSLHNCVELKTVDLSENELMGSIPTWIGNFLGLVVLNFRSNKFHGEIPYELCYLTSLQILDLAHNNISGIIPKCFNNFSAMAKEQSSTVLMYYTAPNAGAFESASLVMKGIEVEYSTTLQLVTSLDLSNNSLFGEIPNDLINLLGLRWLNLSNNCLTGRIPDRIGAMGLLESLDFSVNQLSGEIPPSMSNLTFLSCLNLSYNNLKGKIPSSTQLQSLENTSFIGNKLCGPPLTKDCNDNGLTPEVKHRPDGVDGFKVEGFFLSMALGFVVGFWVVVGPLLFRISWRTAFFRFLNAVWHKISDVIFASRIHCTKKSVLELVA